MLTFTNAHGCSEASSEHSRFTSSYKLSMAKTVAPYAAAATIFSRSRSAGDLKM